MLAALTSTSQIFICIKQQNKNKNVGMMCFTWFALNVLQCDYYMWHLIKAKTIYYAALDSGEDKLPFRRQSSAHLGGGLGEWLVVFQLLQALQLHTKKNVLQNIVHLEPNTKRKSNIIENVTKKTKEASEPLRYLNLDLWASVHCLFDIPLRGSSIFSHV